MSQSPISGQFLAGVSGDEKARFIRRSVYNTEKNMQALQESIASLQRNQERTRRKTMALAVTLKNFGESESPATGQALLRVADGYSELQRTRQLVHGRVQSLVLEPLKVYKLMCKKIKADLRTRDSALEREHKNQKRLDQTAMRESGNVPKISQQQIALATSAQEVVNAGNALSLNMANFEARKMIDLRQSLNEMLYAEIAYHARALEILSQAHRQLLDANLDQDADAINALLQVQRTGPADPALRGKPFDAQIAEAVATLSPVSVDSAAATSAAPSALPATSALAA